MSLPFRMPGVTLFSFAQKLVTVIQSGVQDADDLPDLLGVRNTFGPDWNRGHEAGSRRVS